MQIKQAQYLERSHRYSPGSDYSVGWRSLAMIFSLDEDISHLKLTDFQNENPPIAIYDECDDNAEKSTEYIASSANATHLSSSTEPIPLKNASRPRRRSSVFERLPVITPPHTKRVSITSASLNSDGVIGKVQQQKLARNLKDFTPVRVLGKGAYGKVILVRDVSTNKLYAMKQLRKAEIVITDQDSHENKENEEKLEKDDVSKRIERTFAERTILSELEHPNIVKLFYSFHDNFKLYLLLQYIPGGELFFHLKEHGTFDESTVAFYAAEISCALKFLHDKGIVYRDLKPENCLLDQNGHLVLTDFGLSKKGVTESESNEEIDGEDPMVLHSIIGTPEYCAPEILQGLAYTKNCDWYSLGCLIYDMLVGKPPYTGVNHKVILSKIQKQAPKLPYYLSEGMKDILTGLLKRDHIKRWDVDKYWRITHDKKAKSKKKRKAGQERTSAFTSHFIFRKIDWKKLESGELQRSELGPIVPLITDWSLAENFDTEFTSMSYENEHHEVNELHIPKSSDLFKGFSYNASGSYLERYF